MKRTIEFAGLAVVVVLAGLAGYCLERIAALSMSRLSTTVLVFSMVTVFLVATGLILQAVVQLNRHR